MTFKIKFSTGILQCSECFYQTDESELAKDEMLRFLHSKPQQQVVKMETVDSESMGLTVPK